MRKTWNHVRAEQELARLLANKPASPVAAAPAPASSGGGRAGKFGRGGAGAGAQDNASELFRGGGFGGFGAGAGAAAEKPKKEREGPLRDVLVNREIRAAGITSLRLVFRDHPELEVRHGGGRAGALSTQ